MASVGVAAGTGAGAAPRVRVRATADSTQTLVTTLAGIVEAVADDSTEAFNSSIDSAFNLSTLQSNLTSSYLGKSAASTKSISSTHTTLVDHARKLPAGFVLLADEQTAGIGRLNNTWESPTGCLMLSAKLPLPSSSPQFMQYLVSIAIAQAASESLNNAIDTRLKWPNDVLLRKHKLAGVLTSVASDGIIIGFGLNVRNKPSIGTSLKDHVLPEQTLEPNEVLAARVLSRTEALLHQMQRDGWQSIEPVYLRMWLHSGQRVRINTNQSSSGGRAGVDVTIRGLTDSGYLLAVEDKTGSRHELHPAGTSLDLDNATLTSKR
jgi:biotin-[acetyl-CoA-carboxylase] ligase BirA-like protein